LESLSADLRHARIDDRSNEELWEVKTSIAGSVLEIAEDVSKRKTAYARTNSRPFLAEGFTVNDERQILQETLR
jgi:hypothetical protein